MKRSFCCALVLLLFAVCTQDYNPFDDPRNAYADLSWASFAPSDTLDVFSSETLQVYIAAKELVDSIALRCEHSRTFNKETTLVADSSLYTFRLSFFDTGSQIIEIVTWRIGGEEIIERLSVYVRTPLVQSHVTGSFDEALQLHTPGVTDDDVMYHWDFGKGAPILSPHPDTLVAIREAGTTGEGWLWVSNVKGSYASPKSSFTYAFVDDAGPEILCINEEYTGSDTIVTGYATYFLKVEITDRGKGGVLSATVDSAAFDMVDDPLYVKILYQLDTLQEAQPVLIEAIDNGTDHNLSQRQLYVRYDSTASTKGEDVTLFVLVPSQDSVVSHSRSKQVYGFLENYHRDSLVLSLSVNDSNYVADSLGSAFRCEWGWPVYLNNTYNTVALVAKNQNDSVVVDTTFSMIFDSSAQDVTKPMILAITLNDEPAHSQYVDTNVVAVEVVVFDEGSGLASLTIQGKNSVGNISDQYVLSAEVALTHSQQGNVIDISAIDNVGLKRDTSVTIFLNSGPQLSITPEPPYPLLVGETYLDSVSAKDADDDRIVYALISDYPVGMVLDSITGKLTWTPQISDTGRHTILISVTDYLQTELVHCTLTVVDSTSYGTMVSFVTTEQDFPQFVEGGVDSIRVPLVVTGGAGGNSFSAVRRWNTTEHVIAMEDSVFSWLPDSGDTGFQHMTIIVADQFERTDTLFPIVQVVPLNRPCSLFVSSDLDTLPDGSLDLTQSTDPETLTFHIGDPDPSSSEQYSVAVTIGGRQDVRTIQGADTFLVVLDPQDLDTQGDTIIVTITDRGGHADTLVVQTSGVRVYKKVLLDMSSVDISEDVYNFPVMIRLEAGNIDFDLVESDGRDIRFRKADGTYLAHEIEEWHGTVGPWVAWVCVDTIYSNEDSQYFYIVSNDDTSSFVSSGETVFDTTNGFVGVWHFGDGSVLDATYNSHDAVNYGAHSDTGMVGACMSFGSNTRLKVHHDASFNQTEVTLSLWFAMDSIPTAWPSSQPRLWDKTSDPGNWWEALCLALDTQSTYANLSLGNQPNFSETSPGLRLTGFGDSLSRKFAFSSADAIEAQAGVWQHVCIVVGDDTVRMWIDGENVSEATGIGIPNFNTSHISMGNSEDLSRDFTGRLDEVRYEHIARSASWIKVCYANQRLGSSFVLIENP